MPVRFTSGWVRNVTLEDLLGYSLIIKGKVRRGRNTLSFLGRHPASIISSLFRLSRGIFLSLHGQARSKNYCVLCIQRACPNLLSSLGRMWGSMAPLFHCLGARLMLLLYGSAAKQACLVLWLSKPTLLSHH